MCRELLSLAIMPPSKVCPQCQASVPLTLKLCKCCQHVFQSKRKAEYSLSDQATKRMRVSKATKRASETSEQTLHRQQQDRKCKASTRANKTSEQSVHRKQHDRKCKASMRANETSEQTLHRQQQDRQHKASMRATKKTVDTTYTCMNCKKQVEPTKDMLGTCQSCNTTQRMSSPKLFAKLFIKGETDQVFSLRAHGDILHAITNKQDTIEVEDLLFSPPFDLKFNKLHLITTIQRN